MVLLLIDEIYLTAWLDYRSKSIIGAASNKDELAKTVLTFMISSGFGVFEKVVKLLPVNNIRGNDMGANNEGRY